MPNLNTILAPSGYPMRQMMFGAAAVAASQSNVQLKTTATDAASGSLNITRYNAVWAGSIVGISWSWSAVITAGTFSLVPTIDGVVVAPPTGDAGNNIKILLSGAQNGCVAVDAQLRGLRWVAPPTSITPHFIGVQLTTSGAFAPTTLDLQVELAILYEYVQL